MPRAWLERVCEWPVLQAGVWYLLRVVSVEKSADPPGVRVQFEFLDADQAGRMHMAVLPVPVRPSGLVADFFRAAGLDVIAGGTVSPKAVVGRTVRAQFTRDAHGGWQIDRFAAPEQAEPLRAG
jgi:hypothetical protein